MEECGKAVVDKARELGVEPRVGIRQFLVTMIDHLPEKDGRPGFKLLDENNIDVAEDTTKVAQMIERLYRHNPEDHQGNSTTKSEQPADFTFTDFCNRDA